MAFNPLLTQAANDGSQLELGEDPADPRQPFRLVFRHNGVDFGAAKPLTGDLNAFWVVIEGVASVVFAGDDLDEPRIDRVTATFPGRVGQSYEVRRVIPRQRKLWMSQPVALTRGMIVEFWWTGGDEVYNHQVTPPLEWGMLIPAKLSPPSASEPSRPDDKSGSHPSGSVLHWLPKRP